MNENEYLRFFYAALKRSTQKYGAPKNKQDAVANQKAQVERLVALEQEWHRELLAFHGYKAYEAFAQYILRKGYIKKVKPFFRERQEQTVGVLKSLRLGEFDKVAKLGINWRFIEWAHARFEFPERMEEIKKHVYDARRELTEMNMPLAIQRAKMFFNVKSKPYISLLDCISMAVEGLIIAIDKYTLPYSPVFCSVAIGRMKSILIDTTFETQLYFYPKDRRRLYRVNKFLSQNINPSAEELLAFVNSTKPGEVYESIDLQQLDELISASHVHSGGLDIDQPADELEVVENNEIRAKLFAAVEKLSIFDQKILKLKGITW